MKISGNPNRSVDLRNDHKSTMLCNLVLLLPIQVTLCGEITCMAELCALPVFF